MGLVYDCDKCLESLAAVLLLVKFRLKFQLHVAGLSTVISDIVPLQHLLATRVRSRIYSQLRLEEGRVVELGRGVSQLWPCESLDADFDEFVKLEIH